MNILIVSNAKIPANKYGGTERMIWWLGRELHRLGHQVTYLCAPGSGCPFAKVLPLDPAIDMNLQVPDDIDVVHFHLPVQNFTKKPCVVTVHDNPPASTSLHQNSVFVSGNHAERYGSATFIYNGIDFADYRQPCLSAKRNYTHFLAKAAWRLKNVRGAIDIATQSGHKLVVMGGTRLNIKMGFRFTLNLNVRFKGMVDNDEKSTILNGSKALIFPVLWHEPFGIAIIESLYFGCPVLGTPYGSLPELVPTQFGLLSNSKSVLAEGLKNVDNFDKRLCHEYAADHFNISRMTHQYLQLYERVLNGEQLNETKPAWVPVEQPKFLPWNN